MRHHRLGRVGVITALALACFPVTPAAQMFVATGRDTLRGLPGVEVVVEALPPELQRIGLTTAGINGDIARRLRAAGVVIYGSQKENPSSAKAYVYVHLNPVVLPEKVLAVAIQVHVRQTVQSPVTRSNIVDAMTWDAHDVLVVPETGSRALSAAILEMVDRLIVDWRAVH
jgi:hypothetical protein